MSPPQLPPGWIRVQAADICSSIPNGSTPPAERMGSSGEVPFVKVYNLTFDGILDFSKNPTFISRETHQQLLARSRARPGDVLMNIVGPPLGKTSILPDTFPEWNFNQAIVAFRTRSDLVCNRYFAAYLRAVSSRWSARFSKATVGQHNIAVSDCRRMEVDLPPLNEQRRIVAKLEDLLARSRRAKDTLDAIPLLLEKLRQSILAAAFRGDLTADWRAKNPDVEPAEELLKRIRIERRKKWEEAELAKLRAKGKAPTDDRWKAKYKEPEPVDASELPELPDGWCWAAVHEVASVIDPNPSHRNPEYTTEGFPFVSTQEFIADDSIELDTPRRVSEDTIIEQERRCRFSPRSILFSRKGTIGKTRMFPARQRLALLDSLCVVNPEPDVNAESIRLMLDASAVELEKAIRGVALPQVSVGRVRDLLIPVPPPDEQQTFVAIVKRALSTHAHLCTLLKEVNSKINALERGTMSKAFRGELVAQDPHDEPASAMINRLSAERELTQEVGLTTRRAARKERRA